MKTFSTFVIAAMTVSLVAGQHLQRHPGCPPEETACVFPPNDSVILSGSRFDLKVEIHEEDGKQDNHSVTMQYNDGTAVSVETYFPDFTTAEYEFTDYETLEDRVLGNGITQQVYSETWREVSIKCPGEYTITVTSGTSTVAATWTVPDPADAEAEAKSAILFIADGMTQSMITAARIIAKGIELGRVKDTLVLEKLPNLGLVATSGLDSIITDSANSASAYNTGHKSSVNALGVYADTTEDNLDDPKQETLAEILKEQNGKCIGVVTTAEVQDATPAAVWAHTRRRGDKDIITDQFINGVTLDGTPDSEKWIDGIQAEVLLGGGGKYFHAPSSLGETDYYATFSDAGYTIIHTGTDLESIVSGTDPVPEKLLGIFHEGNMDVWLDRNVYPENLQDNQAFPDGSGAAATDQPGLALMVQAALQVLTGPGCENGYYLMVEAASVDKAMHPNDIHRGLADLIEYDMAVKTAVDFVEGNGLDNDTLIVVTADHGHGFDVYGVVDTQALAQAGDDISKRDAIGTYADAGYPTYEPASADGYQYNWSPRYDFAATVNNGPDHYEAYAVRDRYRTPAVRNDEGIAVANPDNTDRENGFFQVGNLPGAATVGVHTLQDVPVYASGPGSDYFRGFHDNTDIFHGMAQALGAGSVDVQFCEMVGGPADEEEEEEDNTGAANLAVPSLTVLAVSLLAMNLM